MQEIILTIFLLLTLLYVVLILLYKIRWSNVPNYAIKVCSKEPTSFISVIIPCRNEEDNISNLLDSIKEQSYPDSLFEVIVVDDFSSDNSKAIIESYVCKNIQYVSLKDHLIDGTINSYKKKAIEIGISLSKGELILTTDADCVVNKDWLKTIAAFYEDFDPDMIVMPVVIEENSNPIEVFQSLDFLSLQGITGAAVHHQMHGMCNGANLAYKKDSFFDVGGFDGINHIASGDDMMLMHKFYAEKKKCVLYLKAEDVIVKTKAQQSVRAFLNQRIRWASKADKYQDKTLFPVLLAVYLFNASLFILGLLCLFLHSSLMLFDIHLSIQELFAVSLITKSIVEFYFLHTVAAFFSKKKLLWFFPLFVPFHILYTVIAGWMGKFGQYHWKERKVK